MVFMTIDEKQDEIIEEFEAYDDWMEKYEYLIALGKDLPMIAAKNKTDDKLIKGCQSRVWLQSEMKNGHVIFTGDSDAIITKGLVSLLISVLTHHTPAEIAKTNIYFLEKIGLSQHLSPTRANGLLAMLQQMRNYGIAYQTIHQHES